MVLWFKSTIPEVEEVPDLVKTGMAVWIKGKYTSKEYLVEDFKRCLDGIGEWKFSLFKFWSFYLLFSSDIVLNVWRFVSRFAFLSS